MTTYLDNLTDAFRLWNIRRETVANLVRLDAHQLDDIGIARGDIDEIATRQAKKRVARERAEINAVRERNGRRAPATGSASLVGCG
ncbi:MAG: DUF1127 domain-containing protein [Rhodospirillaceae bacterium]|nr:DUF1127 domain-containing protein [Rhodospirillaceae bacterium]